MTDVRRVAIVGTGSRAQLFTRGLAQRAGYTVAALCDPSPTRMGYHNRLLIKAGEGTASLWSPGAFAEMLAKEDITDVVVSARFSPSTSSGCSTSGTARTTSAAGTGTRPTAAG